MILVTGGAGYIGSHCVLDLINSGYEVVIFDNLETGHIETVNTLKDIGSVKYIKGDLKNPNDINSVFDKYDIDAVIHFAACSLVEESVKNPAKYYRNNVYGTLNLVDAMINHGVKRLVFSSTCATYGEPKYIPIDELHPQNPINPYGMSKLVIEKILKDYDEAYGLKSVILRYFNVAGADEKSRIGEWHICETHLIPNILKSAIGETKEFTIYGSDYNTKDGTCIRDYVNVNDLALAHRLALVYLNEQNRSEIFNLGTQDGSSVKEVFELSEKVLDKKIPLKIAERRSGDPEKLIADAHKAKEILGWSPQKNLIDSIESAYKWEIKLK